MATETSSSTSLTASDANTGETETEVSAPVTASQTSTTTYRISGRNQISEEDPRYAGHNIITITDDGNDAGPVGSSYTWEANRMATKTNGVGDTTELFYDDLGMVSKMIGPAPNVDRADLPPGAPTGRVETSFAYDYSSPASDCSQPQGGGGAISTDGYCFAVADMDQASYASNLPGQSRSTDFTHDTSGNLTQVSALNNANVSSEPDRTTAFTYYSSGLLRSIDGPRIGVTDVATFGNDDLSSAYGGYSRSGHPGTITDAEGNSKTMAYSPYGVVGKLTDRAGKTATFR